MFYPLRSPKYFQNFSFNINQKSLQTPSIISIFVCLSLPIAVSLPGFLTVVCGAVFRRIKLQQGCRREGVRIDYYSQMRKKISRQKEIRVIRQRRCLLCLPPSPQFSLSALPPHQLKKRYYHPQIQTYHFRATSNLLYDPYSSENVQLAEMRKLALDGECLQRYLPFAETVQTIRSVITRRVEKDFYGWVDFNGEHFAITNNYYLRRKQLVQNGRQMQKYLKNTSQLQSTGSGDDKHVREYIKEKIKKQLDQQRLVQPGDANSIIDLQRLTRNIEAMVEKIADLSTIRPSKRKNTQQAHPLMPQFNPREISAIEKFEAVGEQEFQEPKDYQETYGLETIRPKNNKGKKVNKLALRSMDRLNGLEDVRAAPETPSPRFVHGLRYPEEGAEQRGNKLPPLSPNNHSSSSLRSKNSSIGKNKSTSRRR